jgi:C4-dicarboxylate-specific signal transduction histidine kinase
MRASNDTPLDHLLTDEQVALLAPFGVERRLEIAELLFDETATVDSLYVVLDGRICIFRLEGAEEKEIGTHLPGEFTGGLAVLTGKRSIHRARAITPARVLEIESGAFYRMAAEVPEVADVFISRLASRLRDTQRTFRQLEKMAALGKISAGLAHELNNPAAAALRAATQLREAARKAQLLALEQNQRFSAAGRAALAKLLSEAEANSTSLDPLALLDREDELGDWLDGRGFDEAWDLAPALAAGFDAQQLEDLAAQIGDESLKDAVGWLAATLELTGLAAEVSTSATRISELVGSMKRYTYMDRAASSEVDVREGIEDTLAILAHKLGGLSVTREYEEHLPKVHASGSELNQVWTNLIDNAADAVDGHGGIGIRAFRAEGHVVVEVSDSGPGVPRQLKDRIFEPFFTTKDVGEGTGLGLDIVRRVVSDHGGDISVRSEPGETTFRVQLPWDVRESYGRSKHA